MPDNHDWPETYRHYCHNMCRHLGDISRVAEQRLMQQMVQRGYRGLLLGIDGVEVAFLSASEIAQNLRDGKIDLALAQFGYDQGSVSWLERTGGDAAELRLVRVTPEGSPGAVTVVGRSRWRAP